MMMLYLRRKPAYSNSGSSITPSTTNTSDTNINTRSMMTGGGTATIDSSNDTSINICSSNKDKQKQKKRYCKRSTYIAAVSIFCVIFLVFMQGRIATKYLFVTTSNDSTKAQIRHREAMMVAANEESSTDGSSDKFCSAITTTRGTAGGGNRDMSKLWIEHVITILEASRHPDDPQYSHKDWTKSLLVELTPSVLQQQQYYNDQANIQRIIDIVMKRIENPLSNPPLKIAVLGGSTTEGNGCEVASVKPPKDSMMGNPTYCAWPYRLESFINNVLWSLISATTTTARTASSSIVKVVNMAEEGTSTTVKTPLLKYWMYPKELLPEGPDVIIHAYTARDALPFEHENESLIDALHREVQTLVDSVKVARPCGHPPLVIHLSDTSLVSPLKKDTHHKSNDIFLSLDYTKVIAKVSAFERKQLQLQQQQYLDDQDIAFGMAGHVAIVWLLAYNIAQSLLLHCHDIPKPNIGDYNKCQESPCIFAWLAGPTGTATHAHQINSQLAPYIKENTGWRSETDMTTGWSRKAGLVAVERNAKLVLEHNDIPVVIRMINVMAVKSYSSKFLNSVARFKVSVYTNNVSGVTADQNEEAFHLKWSTSFDIQGTHTSMTHITFPFALDMKENAAQVGDTLQVEVTLVSGSTFKILGMMFCSR